MLSLFRKNPVAPLPAEPEAAPAPDVGAVVQALSQQASTLGREAAEVRGVIDDTHKASAAHLQAMRALAQQLQEVHQAQDAIGARTQASLGAVGAARQAVESVGAEVSGIVDTLRQVSEAAGQITQIALQTRLVAFNASVEAKRAGDAGRGFGVVADAVKDLAAKVEESSKEILGTVAQLDARVEALARDIQRRAGAADAASEGAVHRAFADVERNVGRIHAAALSSQQVCAGLNDQVGHIETDVRQTARALDAALGRTETFLKISEALLETVADWGVQTPDTRYIQAAREAAAQVTKLLADAVRTGAIAAADLFDERYRAVPQSNPAQHTTRFSAIADRLFPQVQEKLLGLSDKVVFCIAVDRNGYVACHNQKYNHPQRAGDLAWSTANCRNRRIFNDRTGLASARNTRPFLLQTYRRDMGGGHFVVMKEVAAPITVDGRHWGGLRLAYQF